MNKGKNVKVEFGNNEIRLDVVESHRGECKDKVGRVGCKFFQVRGHVFISSSHLTLVNKNWS